MSSSIKLNALTVLIKFVEYCSFILEFLKSYKGYSHFNFMDESLAKLDFCIGLFIQLLVFYQS